MTGGEDGTLHVITHSDMGNRVYNPKEGTSLGGSRKSMLGRQIPGDILYLLDAVVEQMVFIESSFPNSNPIFINRT